MQAKRSPVIRKNTSSSAQSGVAEINKAAVATKVRNIVPPKLPSASKRLFQLLFGHERGSKASPMSQAAQWRLAKARRLLCHDDGRSGDMDTVRKRFFQRRGQRAFDQFTIYLADGTKSAKLTGVASRVASDMSNARPENSHQIRG